MSYRPKIRNDDGTLTDLPIEAETAVKLKASRNIGLSGVVSTPQSFNGTSAITIPITAVPTTLLTGVASIDTTGNAANADTVDGKHAHDFATAEQGRKADTALQYVPDASQSVKGITTLGSSSGAARYGVKDDVGLSNVSNERQYSANNLPPITRTGTIRITNIGLSNIVFLHITGSYEDCVTPLQLSILYILSSGSRYHTYVSASSLNIAVDMGYPTVFETKVGSTSQTTRVNQSFSVSAIDTVLIVL